MAILPEDERDIRRYHLTHEHTKHDGSQIWSGPAVHEDTGAYNTSTRFYRAMSLAELDSYRTRFAFDKVAGHQGWAPYRSYSKAYLKAGQTRLVEAHLPGFVNALGQEGWFIGKVETGCISWGIGLTQSNGWRGGAGIRPRSKQQAQDPWDIFHDCLARGSLKVVNVLAIPI